MLGESVMNAYHLSVKTDQKSFENFQEGMNIYYGWYCDPKASLANQLLMTVNVKSFREKNRLIVML